MYNEINIEPWLYPAPKKHRKIIEKMLDYILENNIVSLKKLTVYAMDNNISDWIEIITTPSVHTVNAHLQSGYQDLFVSSLKS